MVSFFSVYYNTFLSVFDEICLAKFLFCFDWFTDECECVVTGNFAECDRSSAGKRSIVFVLFFLDITMVTCVCVSGSWVAAGLRVQQCTEEEGSPVGHRTPNLLLPVRRLTPILSLSFVRQTGCRQFNAVFSPRFERCLATSPCTRCPLVEVHEYEILIESFVSSPG